MDELAQLDGVAEDKGQFFWRVKFDLQFFLVNLLVQPFQGVLDNHLHLDGFAIRFQDRADLFQLLQIIEESSDGMDAENDAPDEIALLVIKWPHTL